MNFDILKRSIEQLKNYVVTLDKLEKINLTYGIADHFLMEDEYLEKIYHLGADLIESANLKNPYNGIFFTASMIGKNENILKKVNKLHKIAQKRGVPFYIIAVLDPKNLYHKKFGEIYASNIIETNKLIGRVDLSINLSEEAIDKITPKELYDFATANHFDEVTINWVPTEDNIEYVYFDQAKLSQWLIDFDNLISDDDKLSTSYRPVMKRTINSLMCKSNYYEESLSEHIKMQLPELVKKSIQIDHEGNVFPKYEAIGDISHNPRFNIPAWGNVQDNKPLSKIIENGIFQTEKFVLKQFTKSPCVNCEFNKFCANSGFHVYNYILGNDKNLNTKLKIKHNIEKNGCYHIGKNLFNHYYKQLEIIHPE